MRQGRVFQPNEASHRSKSRVCATHQGQGRWEQLKYLRILTWKGVFSPSARKADRKYTSRRNESLGGRRTQCEHSQGSFQRQGSTRRE